MPAGSLRDGIDGREQVIAARPSGTFGSRPSDLDIVAGRKLRRVVHERLKKWPQPCRGMIAIAGAFLTAGGGPPWSKVKSQP